MNKSIRFPLYFLNRNIKMCYEVTEKTKVPNAAIKKYESILKYIFPKITILFLANVMFNCSKNKHNLQLQS